MEVDSGMHRAAARGEKKRLKELLKEGQFFVPLSHSLKFEDNDFNK